MVWSPKEKRLSIVTEIVQEDAERPNQSFLGEHSEVVNFGCHDWPIVLVDVISIFVLFSPHDEAHQICQLDVNWAVSSIFFDHHDLAQDQFLMVDPLVVVVFDPEEYLHEYPQDFIL